MTLQTIKLSGERYVVLREKDFRDLEKRARSVGPADANSNGSEPFREIIPLKTTGMPASELLLQDRR